jgi:hypothetical protein
MKRLLITAVTFCGILLGQATTPAKATTPTLDETCTGTISTTYSPGLLFTPQLVNLNSHLRFGPCKSSDPRISSRSIDFTGGLQESCLELVLPASGLLTIAWNNDRSSTFAFTIRQTIVAGQVIDVATGTIQAGEFTGDTALVTAIVATLNFPKCLAPPGLTSTSGVLTLSIVKP